MNYFHVLYRRKAPVSEFELLLNDWVTFIAFISNIDQFLILEGHLNIY